MAWRRGEKRKGFYGENGAKGKRKEERGKRKERERDLADKLFAAGVVCESVKDALSLVEDGTDSRVDFTLLIGGGCGVCLTCCCVVVLF